MTTADVYEPRYYGRDSGCHYAPSCLNCPFPICLEEITNGRGKTRRLFIIQAERLLPEESAQRFGITMRTAYRLDRAAAQLCQ